MYIELLHSIFLFHSLLKNCFFSVIWKRFFFPSVLFFKTLITFSWLFNTCELYVHKILCMIESTSGSIKNIFSSLLRKKMCINVISLCDKLLFIHKFDTLCCQFILYGFGDSYQFGSFWSKCLNWNLTQFKWRSFINRLIKRIVNGCLFNWCVTLWTFCVVFLFWVAMAY